MYFGSGRRPGGRPTMWFQKYSFVYTCSRSRYQISKSCYLDPSTRYLSTMKSTRIAVFLLSGSAASVSAELNVAKMLILKDRANNNAGNNASDLGESITGKENCSCESSYSGIGCENCYCCGGSENCGYSPANPPISVGVSHRNPDVLLA